MHLRLARRQTTRRVHPQDVLDYGAFSEKFHGSWGSKELTVFEKFITVGLLLRQGYDTYLDPTLRSDDDSSTLEADACGVKGSEMIVGFCSTGLPDSRVWKAVERVVQSENGTAFIVSPEVIDVAVVEREVPGSLKTGKLRLETLGWFEDTLEQTLQQTLHTIELLVNETRIRMLAPLLQKSALKKEFRARINPKLVYHNLSALSEAGLVDEPIDGTYELSHLGRNVLGEFIAFLEKTRRTLDDHRSEEVRSIGRR